MSVIHAPREIETGGRLVFVPIVIGLAILGLFLRLWYLQVVQSDELRERASMYGRLKVEKLAPRGLIVDRNGKLLAGVKPTILLTAKPNVIKKHPEVIDLLASMLDAPKEKLEDKLKDGATKPDLPTPLFVGAGIDVATKVVEQPDRFPGIGVESQPMRFYTDTMSLAHVLGYVWTPSESDVKRLESRDLQPAKYVGKVGVEYAYEELLMGSPGVESMEVDARRRFLRALGVDAPIPGDKLVLSLDYNLQVAAMRALGDKRGAIVAIDPSNGEVLCLVSSPTYDTSLFQGGISKKEYAKLQNDPDHPQVNRAIYGAYAPGSTFKIITSIAAAQTGVLNYNQYIHCPGYYLAGGRKTKCMGAHGSITYDRALTRSCNTYFNTLGVRAGPDALRAACKAVGLGGRTGVDLLGEGKGIVPTREWIEQYRKPPKWYIGDTVNFSIGQGEVAATPIQMASVAAIVANMGVSYRPHLLRQSIDFQGNVTPYAPEVLGKVDVGPQFWEHLRTALFHVIEVGTAKRAQIAGLRWGGKTGSAENRRDRQTHSWFVGFAPLESSKIAIAVVVEHAGHGGDVAAPIAARIVREYLRPTRAGVQVHSDRNTTASSMTSAEAFRSPNSR